MRQEDDVTSSMISEANEAATKGRVRAEPSIAATEVNMMLSPNIKMEGVNLKAFDSPQIIKGEEQIGNPGGWLEPLSPGPVSKTLT